jgi:trimeric autotransporter adhesin
MKRNAFLLLAAVGVWAVAAQAAWPQAPDAAQAARAASVSSAQGSVPRLVQFAGTLKDAWARPVFGVASATFAIYAEQDGGTLLWSETQNVIADANGHYNAVLGAATANGVPEELFGAGQSRWLGVTIARQPEMPRVLIASVPYALKADDAEKLGGLPASAYVTTQNLAAITAKTAIPATTSGSAASIETPRTGTQAVIPAATTLTGSGTADFIPRWTSSTALGNSVLFQSGGGNIGFNTQAPTQLLDVNGNSVFRGSFQLMPGGTATAGGGDSSHSMQWNASVFNSGTATAETFGLGFRAVPVGNDTAAPSANLDLFYGPGGGTLTNIGFAVNSLGQVGINGSPSLTGSTEGPLFTLMLKAVAPNAASGSESSGISALEGMAGNGDQTFPTTGGYGVTGYGGAGGEGGGDGAGGHFSGGNGTFEGDGITAITGSGLAGSFLGNVTISGTLMTSMKMFKIDHPQDPANKYLVHASVESSEMMNIYTGNVVLDADGAATVELPSWFQAENADFRYSLAAVGAPAPNLYVAEEVAGNQFKIAGGRSGQKISWAVTGVRQDAYAKANPLVVEEDKNARERGYYISPEAYGQPEEKGIEWARHPQMMKRVKAVREEQLASRKKLGAAEAQPSQASPVSR